MSNESKMARLLSYYDKYRTGFFFRQKLDFHSVKYELLSIKGEWFNRVLNHFDFICMRSTVTITHCFGGEEKRPVCCPTGAKKINVINYNLA